MNEYARADTPSGSPEALTFEDLGLPKDVVESLAKVGVAQPTPFHKACIPAILAGKDVAGKIEPGIERVATFGPPIAIRVDTNRVSPQALVLTPARERAQEMATALKEIGAPRNLRVAAIVPGVHTLDLLVALRRGPHVLVGTPGRILDLLREEKLSLGWIEVAVIDDADRMLDAGLAAHVEAVFERVPKERQTLLFSAKMTPEVRTFLRRYLKKPEVVSALGDIAAIREARHFYVECDRPRKFRELEKILRAFPEERIVVFVNDDREASDLDRALWGHGYSAGSLSGGGDQDERSKKLEAFRSGEVKILVASDAASEGVGDAGCVVSYVVPSDAEQYVRRVGAAKKTGIAITLLERRERRAWERLLREAGLSANRWRPPQVPEAPRAAGIPEEIAVAVTGESSMKEGNEERRGEANEPREASSGPTRRGRRRRGRRRRRASQSGGAPRPEGRPAAPESGSENFRERLARLREGQEKPRRRRLEEVDDDFVRAEYFNVDSAVLERAQGSESSQQSPQTSSKERKRGKRRRRRGRRGREEVRIGESSGSSPGGDRGPRGEAAPPPGSSEASAAESEPRREPPAPPGPQAGETSGASGGS